ncbi:hypothetical protein ABZW11_33770 [Nonomuraea sp. NPDC004580]|uniref:NucA/NucB deoxyribonuclease domain-containing protein n=1 Tax=Nonomuraea sp. NPDC004580 TaxID=3154552 RepID=UPI0033A1EE6A
MRARSILAVLSCAAALLSVVTTPASAAAPPSPDLALSEPTEGSDQPARKKGAKAVQHRAPDCPTPKEGETAACLQVVTPKAPFTQQRPRAQVKDILPIPDWCIENAFTGVWALRTSACEITGLLYTTYRVVNGVRTVTGEASLNVINYSYSSTDLPDWGHQIELSAYQGWGDALAATLSGTTTASGSCTTAGATFPSRPISPLGTWIQGESYFSTTATAPGAIGACTTTWSLTFTNGAYTPAGIGFDMSEIRCDNATAGRAAIGCVVPWYASELVYSQSLYPSLASHVSRAQASGLPGATFDAPLTRTTNETIINTNRSLACGDAPSISGLSCDEYPIARSYEGLSSGGTRRTFDGCNFNLPGQTGPTGVSVCMITATENNAQGGLNTQFFRRERVLDGDPFRVTVGT